MAESKKLIPMDGIVWALEKAGQDLSYALFDGMLTAKFPTYQLIKNIVSGKYEMKDLEDFGKSMGDSIIKGVTTAIWGGAADLFKNFITGAFRGAYKWGAMNLSGLSEEDANKFMLNVAESNKKTLNIPYITEMMTPAKQEDTVQRYFDEISAEKLLKERQDLISDKIKELSFPAPDLLKLDTSKLDTSQIYEIDSLLDRMRQYNITKYSDFQAMMEEIGANPASKYKEAYDLIYPGKSSKITWNGPTGTLYPNLSEFNQTMITPDVSLPDANLTSNEINSWWSQVMSNLDTPISASMPQLSPSLPPVGNTTSNTHNTTYQVSMSPTIQVNGYNKDARQLVQEIGPELMRWMETQSRGSRI